MKQLGGFARHRLTVGLVMGLVLIMSNALQAASQEAIQKQFETLLNTVRGKRVALVTNPTGVDGKLNQSADVMAADGKTTIVAFFAPEHGLRGDTQAGGKVTDYVDPITKVPVYSLYGAHKAPSDEQLKGVDVLVFDIQDVGVRFYTFVWTMTYAMEAAARNHVKFVVVDRPNPIGGMKVEGSPNTSDAGLVGRVWPGKPFGVATRYGMTIGELARMVNGEWLEPKADLEVLQIPGYKRSMRFEETGYPWVFPSPNMPTLDTAWVYPGMCVFEGTNISEGRGTTKPFEIVGAPFINPMNLARDLNALALPGVRFRALYFTPMFGDYAKQQCGGVQVHVLDPQSFDPIRSALHVLQAIQHSYPEQTKITDYAGKLMGDPDLDKRLQKESVEAIMASWQPRVDEFKKVREKYLIYPE